MTEQTPANKTPKQLPASIKPVKKKIGEKRGNLRDREAWFQRRAGSGSKRSPT